MLRILLCSVVLCLGQVTACAGPNFEKSDHFDGQTFFNPWARNVGNKSLVDIIKWKWGSDPAVWPDWVADNMQPQLEGPIAAGEVRATFINHASYLLQFSDFNLLTDPVFSERVSPFSWYGPKRHRAPGIALESLPKISYVIISHNHYDHLDLPSLKELATRHDPLFIVPLGNKALLEKAGIARVVELDWWQNHEIAAGSRISIVPVQHWSARGILDRSKVLWGGYVIDHAGLKVYFAGDTGYGPQFQETFKRMGAMDLSLLPIGAYEPRWFMKEQHMNPDEAVQAHLDLGSQQSLGMHYGTFQLTDESIDQPRLDLQKSLEKVGIAPELFIGSHNGQSLLFHAKVDDKRFPGK